MTARVTQVAADTVDRSAQWPTGSHRRFEPTATRCLLLVVCTIAAWLVFDRLTDSVFLTPRNLTNVSVQISMTALVAIAITGLLIAREMDLSVGALFALITVVSVLLQVRLGVNPYVAMAISLGLGVLVGLCQGAITSFFRVPSFIVTLAAFSYLQGLAYLVTGNEIYAGTAPEFRQLANGTIAPQWVWPIAIVLAVVFVVYQWRRSDAPIRFGGRPSAWDLIRVLRAIPLVGLALVAVWAYESYRGIPVPVVIVGVWAIVFGFTARHLAFGRHVFAIGGNPEAARRAGINLGRVTLVLFGVTGATAAMAGLIEAARLDSGPPNVGLFLALDGISAAVIGGASLFGGVGGIRGTLAGVLLLGGVQNGLGLMGLSSNVHTITSGLILLIVVSLDAVVRRTRTADV